VPPPHIAQAPPCTAKRIQSVAKSLIYRGGGACVKPAVLDPIADANEHCTGFARRIGPTVSKNRSLSSRQRRSARRHSGIGRAVCKWASDSIKVVRSCRRRLQHLDSEVAARPPRSWAHAVFSEEEALRQHGIQPKKVRLDQKRSGTHRNRFDAAIIRCERI
jgi:hypothetical protein